jgi:hypothetical protein
MKKVNVLFTIDPNYMGFFKKLLETRLSQIPIIGSIEVLEEEPMVSFTEEFATARDRMNNLPDLQLDKLLDAHVLWFGTERPDDLSRRSIIDHIMGSDPIAQEGGLLDFLAHHALIDEVPNMEDEE